MFTCVRALIGRHIASLATLTNPRATSCSVIEDSLPDSCFDRKWFTSCVRAVKASLVTAMSSGASSVGPNIQGKYLHTLHTHPLTHHHTLTEAAASPNTG